MKISGELFFLIPAFSQIIVVLYPLYEPIFLRSILSLFSIISLVEKVNKVSVDTVEISQKCLFIHASTKRINSRGYLP